MFFLLVPEIVCSQEVKWFCFCFIDFEQYFYDYFLQESLELILINLHTRLHQIIIHHSSEIRFNKQKSFYPFDLYQVSCHSFSVYYYFTLSKNYKKHQKDQKKIISHKFNITQTPSNDMMSHNLFCKLIKISYMELSLLFYFCLFRSSFSFSLRQENLLQRIFFF